MKGTIMSANIVYVNTHTIEHRTNKRLQQKVTHIEGHALLGHGSDCLFIHMGIVYTHAAEYRESFHEVLVILCEKQVVEFID